MHIALRKWNQILNIQIAIAVILVVAEIIFYKGHQIYYTENNWSVLIALVCIIVTKIIRKKKLTQILSVLFLPYIFLYVWRIAAFFCALKLFPTSQEIIEILFLLFLLVIVVPVTLVNYGEVKNNWFRLLAVMVMLESFIMNWFYLGKDTFVDLLADSGVVAAIAYVIFTIIVVKRWGYHLAINLKLKQNKYFQFPVLILLILFAVWYSFVNYFSNIATSWNELFWHWDFSMLTVLLNWHSFFTALEAGVMEEMERYLFIVVLLTIFKNKRFQIQATIIISSLIFALGHYINLLSNPGWNVNLQVMWAFPLGMFLAVLYLYTGKLFLSMGAHFLIDFFVMSRQTGSSFLLGYGNGEFLLILLLSFILLVPTVLMLFGKRRKEMEHNAGRIIA